MFLSAKYSPIGIDIGNGSLKLVQFQIRGTSRSLVSAARLTVRFPNNGQGPPERDAFVRDLKKLLSLRKFGELRAVVALPPGDVDVRPLTLPMTGPDVADKVKAEVNTYLACGADNAVIDHVLLGEAKSAGERRLEVLAASVEKSKAIASLELLARAGLTAEAIDIVPLALCRVLLAAAGQSQGAIAAVDIGTLSTLAVIMDNGELRMARRIDIGGQTLTDAIRDALELSPEEAEILKCQHGVGVPDAPAIPSVAHPDGPARDEKDKIGHIINDILRNKLDRFASELQKLFRYFSAQSQGRAVDRVVLVGGGAPLKHLDTLLAKRLNTQVEVGTPLTRIHGKPVELREGSEACYAVAAGLALKDF